MFDLSEFEEKRVRMKRFGDIVFGEGRETKDVDVKYKGTIGCGERILDFSYRSGEVQDLPCFFTLFLFHPLPT